VLLLFDIDGTLLLEAYMEHRKSLHAALRRVYRVSDPESAGVDAAGRTDPEIARAILLRLDVSADRIDDGMADFRVAAAEEYARRCPHDLSGAVAPGMRTLLEELSARDGTIVSLVTGNLEPIARLKLQRAGLGAFFPKGQGGFGSDHEDRTELPAVARERAGTRDEPYPRERTVVIGDTPLDIACARADGVGVIGVATGPFVADELYAADDVAESVDELRALLASR
jgi:phosphoglycolate phosphatase-like HAD superfamily hydrolase